MRNPEKPPCIGCDKEMPELFKSNVKVAKFVVKLSTQWNINQFDGSILGLNYQSMEIMARITNFKLDEKNLAKIRAIEMVYIKKSIEAKAKNGK